ncbi:MAG: hypothetical protein ACK4MU_06550, partial [Thermomonas sp.]
LSPVAARLLALTSADDANFDEIVALIEADMSLTSRMLALCRRAAAGFAAAQQSFEMAKAPECGQPWKRALSQNLRRNISLWIKLEKLLEVCRKSLTGLGKFPARSC